MEPTCSNIAVQRTVNDHNVRWMGRSPSTGLPASARDFKTPTQYPNVGDYKGRTGLSPPTAYPSTGGTVVFEGSRAPEHHARVQGNYLYPPGTPTLWINKQEYRQPQRNDKPPPQP